MKEKIFQKIREQQLEASHRYLENIDFIESKEIINIIPKKNADLETILSKTTLIEMDEEKSEKINEFHDYLYKFGIEIGVSLGKQQVIDIIKNNIMTIDKINELNPEDFTKFHFIP